MKRKPDHEAEATALDVLTWLAADEARLLPFLALSGLTPHSLRRSAHDPGFLAAVLDHVMGNEPTLMACAAALAVKPERIAAAWRRMQPPEFDPYA